MLQGRLIRLALAIAAARAQEIRRSVHNHAAPLDEAFDLVYLERHPWIVLEHRDLRTVRRAAVDPLAGEHVRDRLDVHSVVEGEGDSADVIPPEHRFARRAAEVGHRW